MDYDWVIDAGYVPESIVRFGTRQIQKAQEAKISKKSFAEAMSERLDYVANLRSQPIAVETTAANEQQYEVDTGVFAAFLGPQTAMLKEYATKAELQNGMTILDLGYVSFDSLECVYRLMALKPNAI
ncbi:hypothetical protein VFPBJ_11331 [Purpureocillium lilacinum]|uniref:Uncharacterized protein n=1 Tax=Purpureocillium lilacinum TaxID=33203 RepID=A0A179FFA2_PURLI|nr:hypothetical protein VFPBJ_11331 [Purpureocillium lilacinum]